jgi:hypothetical protein
MFSRSKDLPCNYLRFVLSIQNDLTVASSYIKCASLARNGVVGSGRQGSGWMVGNSEVMAEVALGPGKRRNRRNWVQKHFSGKPTNQELTNRIQLNRRTVIG